MPNTEFHLSEQGQNQKSVKNSFQKITYQGILNASNRQSQGNLKRNAPTQQAYKSPMWKQIIALHTNKSMHSQESLIIAKKNMSKKLPQ